ncbi:hypothetical protein HZB88_03090 [archaeon]|nr:hypothetical protein [archaeon]
MIKLLLSVFLTIILLGVALAQTETVTLNFNMTKVWWNDTVNASGATTANRWVQINRSSIAICNLTANINGFYNCSFNAPEEIGSYTYTAYDLSNTGSVLAQTSTILTVALTYGGNTTRGDVSAYEVPMLIQEPTGKIRTVTVKIKVWRVI